MADTCYLREVVNGIPVVAAPLEVDVATAGQLLGVILDAASHECGAVVVDMSCTRFCDSAGVNALVQAHKHARAEGTEVRVVAPAGGAVSRVLNVTGVDRYMPCFCCLADALN